MSRGENTDLVCRARRQELSADERRRLDDLLETSSETRLVSVMLSEFERESRVRPGDDMLLARISAHALGRKSEPPAPLRRRPRISFLLVAAVLLMGSFAWAWRVTVQKQRIEAPPPSAPSASAAPIPNNTAPRRPVSRKRNEPEVIPLMPADENPPDMTLEEQPAARERAPSRGSGSAESAVNPASELFARANRLRRQGRSPDAAALYQVILDTHPNSREAAPARLALAKLLRTQDPAGALGHFRSLAERGGALRPEALWGLAESARRLGDNAAEARALSDLLREFPDSPYADVARRRAADGAR